MARVAARVTDKRVFKLIRAFLKSGVMEDGLGQPGGRGDPQGGPLSPLLSKLVLDDLDKELTNGVTAFAATRTTATSMFSAARLVSG